MKRSGNHIGSLLQLAAKGPQDSHISNKGTTFSFEAKYNTHTQFVVENHTDILKDIRLGSKYVYNVPIKGDMLKNIILKIKLPVLTNDQVYVHNVGPRLIKTVKIFINEEMICEYSGLTMFIFSRLMNNASKLEAFNRMISYKSSTSYYSQTNRPKQLYIPLILWESFGIENYIPFCSIHNSKIKLEIELAKLDELYIVKPGLSKYVVKPQLKLKNGKIRANLNVVTLPAIPQGDTFSVEAISDQIILNKDEQHLLQKNSQEYVFPQIAHQVEKLGSTFNKIYLQFNLPIKQLIWIITNHEEVDDYNFHDFEKAQLIMGSDMSSSNSFTYHSSDYFKYCQSYYHNETIPDYNIFSYSFSLRPYYGNPSGMIDFSKLKVKVLEIHGNDLEGKYIHIFANSINVLETNNGQANLKIKLK